MDLLHAPAPAPELRYDPNKRAGDSNSPRSPIFNAWTLTTVVAVFVIVGAAGAYYYFKPVSGPRVAVQPVEPATGTSTSTRANLPEWWKDDDINGHGHNSTSTSVQAEHLTFSQFYHIPEDDIQIDLPGYSLPLNVKIDVSNYREISRKIRLDDHIQNLNNNGFAVISNQFASEANDFYGIYRVLKDKEIPPLVTSDFLLYYYQNLLKQVYKDIETNVFYNDLWYTSLKLYEIANSRYREYQKAVGDVNDPVLEGQRLEAAYFATALMLLKPRTDQINPERNQTDAKFYEEEVEEYNFELPEYLNDDVLKEVSLILTANRQGKSPVLLYERDYVEFNIPREYKYTAKLNNFYLAAKWMNSLFPLYYISEECPECILDRDDWMVNFIASAHIAKDFSVNQGLKNQWAKIYKIIAFFSGLRRDLTYLNNLEAATGLFGDEYEIDRLFSKDNPEAEENINSLQTKIAEYEFLGIEGGYDRNDPATRQLLGIRFLQEPYWPNDYILNAFVDPKVSLYEGNPEQGSFKQNVTHCSKRPGFRCRAMGLDIINLVWPLPSDYEYFRENSNYVNYTTITGLFRQELEKFNTDAWHNNVYWATLDMTRKYLPTSGPEVPVYADNLDWTQRKVSTSLGLWTDMQLSADVLEGSWQHDRGLGGDAMDEFVYIEPELGLINELIAKSRMLTDALLTLDIINNADLTYKKLDKLIDEMETIKKIIVSELEGQPIDSEELKFIDDFIKQYVIADEGPGGLELKFDSTGQAITEHIEGVRLLMITRVADNKKIFNVGPVYNHWTR